MIASVVALICDFLQPLSIHFFVVDNIPLYITFHIHGNEIRWHADIIRVISVYIFLCVALLKGVTD